MTSPPPIHVLALDIGTSGIRASIYDAEANEITELRTKALTPFADDGEVAPSAETLLETVIKVLDSVADRMREFGINPDTAAISCFWHSLVGTLADGKPTTPLLSWADSSYAGYADDLRSRLDEAETHNRTGCHFHASFWPAKILGLRTEAPGTFAHTVRWLSFSDLLFERITGRCVTGVSMASATGLYDLRSSKWDPEMAGLLALGEESLPPVIGPGQTFRLSEEMASRWPSLAETRWIAPVGDGAANNIGAGCRETGTASLMIGTSGAMRTVFEGRVPERIPEGLFCYLVDQKTVCLGGALSDGGSLRKWLAGPFGLEVSEADVAERSGGTDPGGHGLTFLPFVFGERSTGYHSDASGAVIGLTRGSDAVDMVVSAMESVAYRFAEILERLEKVSPVQKILASGGSLEASSAWQKILADVLGRDIEIVPHGGVSRKGAAILALEAAGVPRSSCESFGSEGSIVRHDPARHLAYRPEALRHREFYRRMLG